LVAESIEKWGRLFAEFVGKCKKNSDRLLGCSFLSDCHYNSCCDKNNFLNHPPSGIGLLENGIGIEEENK
jgi:hypothetical protein